MANAKSRSPRRNLHAIGAAWLLTFTFPLYLLLNFVGKFWLEMTVPFPASMGYTCAFVSSIGLSNLAGKPVTGSIAEIVRSHLARKQKE